MGGREPIDGGSSRTVALLLAAGAGSRLGGEPKAFAGLGGSPIFAYGLRSILACPRIGGIVILAPEGHVEDARRTAEPMVPRSVSITVIEGGSTRQESVRLGLGLISEEARVVVSHDAARPFASPLLFDRVLDALEQNAAEGAVPCVPSPDTVKRVEGGRVLGSIPRDEVALVQTPQAFVASALRSAHEQARLEGLQATDDAMLLEAMGLTVIAVEGDPGNFKITTKEDLARAELELAQRGRKVGSQP